MYGAKNLTIDLPCGAQMYCARFGRGTNTLVMIPGLNNCGYAGQRGKTCVFLQTLCKGFYGLYL